MHDYIEILTRAKESDGPINLSKEEVEYLKTFLPEGHNNIYHCACGRSETFETVEEMTDWKKWHLENDCANFKPL